MNEAIEEIRSLVQADGSDMELVGVDGDVVRLRLVIVDTTCVECVMPRQFLEEVALDILRRADPAVRRVEIDDPREPR